MFCECTVCILFNENYYFVGGGSSRSRKKQGEDVTQAMKVSLEEVYNGTTKKLSLSRNILCKKCKGYVSISAFIIFSFNLTLVTTCKWVVVKLVLFMCFERGCLLLFTFICFKVFVGCKSFWPISAFYSLLWGCHGLADHTVGKSKDLVSVYLV